MTLRLRLGALLVGLLPLLATQPAYADREGPLITRGQVIIVGAAQDVAYIALQPGSSKMLFQGRSMEPAIYEGQTVIVVPVPTVKVKKDDDIAFWDCGIRDGQLLGHRVIEVGQDAAGWYAITKGLQNPILDGCSFVWPYLVREADLVGVLAVVVR